MSITRRHVLAASAALPFAPGVAHAADKVSIRLDPRRRMRAIPAGYMGLGYEASAVATPGLLSALRIQPQQMSLLNLYAYVGHQRENVLPGAK